MSHASVTEHRDTEELGPNLNPAYRGSVNVMLKVWRWISVSEETQGQRRKKRKRASIFLSYCARHSKHHPQSSHRRCHILITSKNIRVTSKPV